MRVYKQNKEDIAMYSGIYGKSECVSNTHLEKIFKSCNTEDEYQEKLMQVLWCGKNELCRPTA